MIWVKNWNGKFVKSLDNYRLVFSIDMWISKQRWWQLLVTPKHILLGAWYGYTSVEILDFVKKHVTDNLDKPHK